MTDTVQKWHAAVRDRDLSVLDELIADEAVFHSPIVHRPQQGKELTILFLTAAFHVLGNDSFHYIREVVAGQEAVLEFVATVDGIQINGVDMFRWNEQGQIVDFKVMIRPLKAIHLLHQKMAEMLESMSPSS